MMLFISPKRKITILEMSLKSSIMSKLDHQMSIILIEFAGPKLQPISRFDLLKNWVPDCSAQDRISEKVFRLKTCPQGVLDPPKTLKYDDVIYGRPFTEIFKFQPATRQLVEYLNNGSVVVQVIGKQYVRKSAVARHKGMHTRDLIKSDRGVFSKYVQLFTI